MVLDGARDPQRVADVLQAIVDEPKNYLRQLFADLEVGATDDTETFQSSGVFPGGIRSLSVAIIAKGKQPTPVTKVTVSEMILDGTFVELFGSLGADRKLWTEAQVAEFCRDHCDKLRAGEHATFFEMRCGVVAHVYFDSGGQLNVCNLSRFCDHIWRGSKHKHRVVSLQ